MVSFADIPDEILLLIFAHLDAKSLASIALTSRQTERNLIVQTLLMRAEARDLGGLAYERSKKRRIGFKPPQFSSWAYYLAFIEGRREEAWVPVAAGRQVCFFVASCGKLTMCGAANRRFNESSILGLGIWNDTDIKNHTNLHYVEHVKFRSVSCGYDFGVAVSVNGQVYTWGAGTTIVYPGRTNFGRVGIGHDDNQSRFVPSLVPALTSHRIVSVSTGYGHCIAITDNGEVFSWGIDTFGQCGHGMISKPTFGHHQITPKRIATHFSRARNASAGKHHTIVVTEKGAVYTFGRGTEGALGHGDRNHAFSPKLVAALSHVRITCSASGETHTLAVSADGTLFAWGENNVGELGTGTRLPSDTPLMVHGEAGKGHLRNVRGVAATRYASCAVTFTGELFTWGTGHALGHGADDISTWGTGKAFFLFPTRVEALRHVVVEAISVRSWENNESQALVVTTDGTVFGWGWGTRHTDQATSPFPDADALVTPCIHSTIACLRPCAVGSLFAKISHVISTQS